MAETTNGRAALARALAANQPGSREAHTVVVLPSYSVGSSLLAHYGHRIPSLEHRHLHSLLMLPRIPACRVLFVTCVAPAPEVRDYYLSFASPRQRRDVAARTQFFEVPDPTPRSVTAKLLDRPDLVARLRRTLRGRMAYLDPWNVTESEARLADLLGVPVNGTSPDLWPLGFKSAGRKLMRSEGVPVPYGVEDVRSVDGIVEAALRVRAARPDAAGVVVKTDDSGTGDGNRVIRFDGGERVRPDVERLEPWFLADVPRGTVVEELVVGSRASSPSVQLDVGPGGDVTVLSTHEQVLGGPNGQVYLGCRFPARPEYSGRLASYGAAVGRALAARGALGRLCVDFTAVQGRSGGWDVYGLEINLRKSGTTHPFTALRHLAPGRYDTEAGRWLADDGSPRCYRSTDNLVDPAWLGRDPGEAIRAVRDAGLALDPGAGTGVVLHMLNGLGIDGRMGLTALGRSPEQAEALYGAAVAALSWRSEPAGVG